MATLTQAKRIVVKIGSALLVGRVSGALRQEWLASLAQDIAGFMPRVLMLWWCRQDQLHLAGRCWDWG